jgi:hypothetical protein
MSKGADKRYSKNKITVHKNKLQSLRTEYTMCTEAPAQSKSRGGVQLTNHQQIVPQLKRAYSYISPPPLCPCHHGMLLDEL